MSGDADAIYNFVCRGMLTEEALDRAGRINAKKSSVDHEHTKQLLSLDVLDAGYVESARAMATVYTAIAAFESSVRELITKVLLENVGEDWWNKCVSEKIRTAAKSRMEEEKKIRWHAQRGEDPIYYAMLPNLMNIIRANQEHFAPFIHDVEWASNIFDIIERSRNIIMHSGKLDSRDIARLGTFIRDWTSQVAV